MNSTLDLLEMYKQRAEWAERDSRRMDILQKCFAPSPDQEIHTIKWPFGKTLREAVDETFEGYVE